MSHHQISITLNDSEIYFHRGSVRISRALESRSTAQFRIRATKGEPVVGQKIGIFDQGIRIFGGTINEATLTPIAQRGNSEAWHDLIVTGWEHRLERHKLTSVAYSHRNAGQIVTELLEYVRLHNEEIHDGTIQAGATAEELGTLIFRGLSVWDAIRELAERSNFTVFVDTDLYLHFVPRDWNPASIEITADLANYRRPEVRTDRADYYNAASIAIALEAFDPYVLSLQGDASHPNFIVYDPDDPEKEAKPIEAIRSIRLNGVDQEIGILGSDAGKVFYYRQGEAVITWDEAEPIPSPEDVITVEFWALGQNVITIEDEGEQNAVLTTEITGSGRYHCYFEDLDEMDADVAEAQLVAFLNDHAPARSGGEAGEWPAEYKWTSFSKELIAQGSGAWRITDLMPGRKITFAPSTPVTTSQSLIIQAVEISDFFDDTQFRYDVRGVKHVPMADDLEFYKTLAEVPTQSPVTHDDPVLAIRAINFVIPGALSTGIQSFLAEVLPGAGRIFRCREAKITAGEAPVGASILADCTYSEDDFDVALASRTWLPIFESSDGDLDLPADQIQRETSLGRFSGFPEALDLPHPCLARIELKQVGSTTAGSDLLVQIIGDIRKAEVEETE